MLVWNLIDRSDNNKYVINYERVTKRLQERWGIKLEESK